ncbi:helix-turn-helix domain-containing protein [Brevundimonas bullata]|uniref:helix-turn-helix domain-containing protein n=1 Tax=Brevundimonas bullata TaxID=13160 RepID=UPI003D9A7AEA
MPKSIFTDAYAGMIEELVRARTEASLTQAELSARLGKPQPFISKIEGGVRRIDVIEFCAIARALEVAPEVLFARVLGHLPAELQI